MNWKKCIGRKCIRLDLYQAETALIAQNQTAILDDARAMLLAGEKLSSLEKNDILHAFQVLADNAIGKAKQTLKINGKQVPISAYDCFNELVKVGVVNDSELNTWNAIVGLRNRIVHDYMNIDMARVLELVENEQYRFIADFLLAPIFDLEPSWTMAFIGLKRGKVRGSRFEVRGAIVGFRFSSPRA